MLLGILLISCAIIVFFTLCLCSISKKETPKPYQNPEQIHLRLKMRQRGLLPTNQMFPARKRQDF